MIPRISHDSVFSATARKGWYTVVVNAQIDWVSGNYSAIG